MINSIPVSHTELTQKPVTSLITRQTTIQS
jgi:hypothetical protein